MEVDELVNNVEKTEVGKNSLSAIKLESSSEILVKMESQNDENMSTEAENIDRSNKENLENIDKLVEDNPSTTKIKMEKPEMDENLSTDAENIDRSNKENFVNIDKLVEDNPSTAIEANEETKAEEPHINENPSDKNLDPYAYLQRPEFSSENFKIEIMNLPKFYGAGVI